MVRLIQRLFTGKTSSGTAWAILCALLISGCATTIPPQGIPLGEKLRVPPGFSVSTITTQVPNARAMAEGPRGTVFVGSYAAGNVYALELAEGRVIKVRTLLRGLASPTSIAILNGALFVATTTQILRYDNIEDRLDNPPAPVTVIDGLLNQRTHAARFIGFGPDEKLYLNLSAPCDLCEPAADEFALIIRTNLDGSNREIVARGVRNTGGFDWHPQSGELWFTQTEADELADSRVNEELNRVTKAGQHFGFPYCRSGDIKDPKFGDKRACDEFVPPVAKLGGHTAPLGMTFYNGSAFPTEFRNNIFIARHGSHDPPRVGYDVVRVVFDESGKTTIKPFVEGFLDENKNVLGRPVGVLVLHDGSMLISDDQNGAIYRVRYVR